MSMQLSVIVYHASTRTRKIGLKRRCGILNRLATESYSFGRNFHAVECANMANDFLKRLIVAVIRPLKLIVALFVL